MDHSPFDRACPRCNTSFTAVSERGVCPNCKLFFRRNRDGKLLGIVATFETPSQFDWPFDPVDDLCAATFEAFHFGGGPLFVSDRHGGFPNIELVHKQLVDQFGAITNSIKPHLPRSADFGHPADKLPSRYDNAVAVECVAWDHGDHHYQLVCFLSQDGGSIDAVLDREADWHSGR
jgi:hypothetical protein